MRFEDVREAQKYRAALLEIIIHDAGGWANRGSLSKVDEFCQAAMSAIDDAECETYIKIVAEHAAALFSARAHRKWDRSSMHGADFLRLEIVRALHSLNRRLCAIEAKRKKSTQAAPRLESFWLRRSSSFSNR